MTDLLISLLDCGYADLNVLLDTEYDMSEIIEYATEYSEKPTLNNLVYSMLQMGINDIQSYIEDNKNDVEEDLDEDKLELFKSIEFNPHEDIEVFINYLDSHAYLVKNEEAYVEFFPEAIDKFEEMTGFSLR